MPLRGDPAKKETRTATRSAGFARTLSRAVARFQKHANNLRLQRDSVVAHPRWPFRVKDFRSQLARGVLKRNAARRGHGLFLRCSSWVASMQRHPEYSDIVGGNKSARLQGFEGRDTNVAMAPVRLGSNEESSKLPRKRIKHHAQGSDLLVAGT